MNNLATVPKNGTLKSTKPNVNFQNWTTNWLDEFLNKDIRSGFNLSTNSILTLPKVNIKETADMFVLDMAIPGLKKSDLSITFDNQSLSVVTDLEGEKDSEVLNFIRKEFNYSSFKRSFTLPESIDQEKINAKYQNGVLSIYLSKRDEAKQKPPKTINIS